MKAHRTLKYFLPGLAAGFVPLYAWLHAKRRRLPAEDVRRQGWPIRLMQTLFTRYVARWVDVKGLENLPEGSYIVASNHAYKSGVDGYILGHLLATHAGRVPRILITADSRNWMVAMERWVLHHYGIALLVAEHHHGGTSDIVANYLRENSHHAVLIFPAGRAVADPVRQLQNWSTGAAVASEKSGCPIVPLAVGGLRLDWSPETVIFSSIEAAHHESGAERPFSFHVRIGKPIAPTGNHAADLETLRLSIADLMKQIPGLQTNPGESDPAFGKMTLRDGRTLAWMDRGPKSGTPILYFHGFQGSRLERVPNIDDILQRLNIRLISPDRPGIGLSTPLHDRTIHDWADDVAELTEHVLGPGVGFSIFGFSAGATYALACGRLPGLKAMTLAAGMGLPHLISGWHRYSSDTWHILLAAKLASLRPSSFLKVERQHHDQVYEHWDRYFNGVKQGLSEDDLRILTLPHVEELFRESRREGYSQGATCLLQEAQALCSDPEIDLGHLHACTVLLLHGLDDAVVPVAVARDLHERIPTSRISELPGRGHYFLYDDAEMETALAALAEAHRSCRAAS